MTTVVDTFNRANTTTGAGTTSDGNGTWVDLFGTSGISSNAGYFPTVLGGFPNGASTVDPGASDGTISVDISSNNTTGDDAGVVFRVVDANNYWLVQASGALWKCVAGSLTFVVGFADNVNGTVSVVLSASSITVKWNGSTLTTQTDSFNSTATKHGIYANTNVPRFDNFSWTPGSPPVPASFRPRVVVRSSAVSRASVI